MYYFSKILLVDDDLINNVINEELLKKLYICDEIITYTSALQAFDFLKRSYENKESLPELILLDINMPGMDGFEFLKILDNIAPVDGYYISALTSSNNAQDKELMEKFGVDHYIIKPLTNQKVDELLKAINN